MKIIIATNELKGIEGFLKSYMKPGRTYHLKVTDTQSSKNKRKNGSIKNIRTNTAKD